MANFLGGHNNKIEKKAPIAVNQLQKGMVINFRYNKKASKGKPAKSKTYLALVLNPRYQGFVHALSMEMFSNNELNNMAEKYGLVHLKVPPMFKALDFPKIVMKEASLKFYASAVKKLIGNKLGKSYRTFIIKSFGPLSVIDYEFDQRIQDLYLK